MAVGSLGGSVAIVVGRRVRVSPTVVRLSIQIHKVQPLRLVGAVAFAIAALFWLGVAFASSSDRSVHLATGIFFALVAALWLATYLWVRSRTKPRSD
jgi:hypothetical protein